MPDFAPKKKIQITSNTSIDAERLHEEVHYNDTGKTKVIDRNEPHITTISKTITGNPGRITTTGEEHTHPKTQNSSNPAEDPATVGFDTSQL
ncbi:hypothetical protein H2203_001106 [Taxawa tesnikishii (nom. ined.)]|nr:hypothetical protein H2203_001106 [Dothideales sp. JES 119]